MIDDHLTPDEEALIEQLRSTPKPQLDIARREAIRQRTLGEFRTVMAQPAPRPAHLIRFTYGLVAALVVVVTVLVIAQISRPQMGGTVTTTTTPQNPVAVVPSETPEPTFLTETLAPTATPTTSATAATSPTLTPVIPSATMTDAPLTSAATPFTLVVVEGPIDSIADNLISVYDFTIEVEPQHPILSLLNPGEIVRIEGTMGTGGVVLANVVGNIPGESIVSTGTTATVSLDGPIEAITDNVVMVNGIQVQIDPANPILQTLQLGNFVSVQGNFEGSGSAIVLVVVNITIVNNVVVGSEPYCWYHEGMGMGHWHCDGMGMGMGMGMGR
jgi:hypothetical protein